MKFGINVLLVWAHMLSEMWRCHEAMGVRCTVGKSAASIYI